MNSGLDEKKNNNVVTLAAELNEQLYLVDEHWKI